ncbi:IS200/IS605 family element transposase accessory protein TnpB [Streptomyces roseirectus]|uniref:IS200/IS605 family element transposase accessory protein TnpB n=1 Tax=Streptomyces roseirectus TaxID=2768066 RepID=A0A7H0IKG5_9ACTN|nr:RNA-guided endonuclease TnpB family protein [Streptomyces roseirectus]QNP73281.1 IS200/IS605 family element transposase accessory protein TnpB [Streptomyces roseirectus]
MQLRYNYRTYPDASQRRALARAFGCARVVWNDCLRDRKEAHAAGMPYVTSAELSRVRITQAKRTEERAWLAEVSAVVLQQSLRDLDTAYKNFFDSLKGKRQGRKAGPPRYKSKKDSRQSVRLNTNAFSVKDNGTVYVAKVGDLKVKWSRRLPAAPTSLTVIRDGCGRYFLSFVVDTEPDILPETEAECGIDLGLSAFAVLSDGTKVASPRFLRRAEKKLRRLQRELSRKVKGSRNRAKARARVARQHARVADRRRDFHHKASTQIIRDNQAVYVEDLAVYGLARTRLAKSVHDAGWSAFTGMLEYKAARHGRTFAKVDRAFPSSQICSACGFRDGLKPLHVREWTCGACGTVHDRDHNAGRNVLFEGRRIVAAGRAETPNACGAPVRRAPVPAQRGEAGSPRKGRTTQAGIPGLRTREHVNVRGVDGPAGSWRNGLG